ncbi:MAG: sensor histidine kinase [Bacteroidota bacterium]
MRFLKDSRSHLDILVHSIRFRLALWFVLILALVLAIFSSLLFAARLRELRAETVNRLESKLEHLENLSSVGLPGSMSLDALRRIAEASDPNSPLASRDILALYNLDGSIAYSRGALSALPILDFSHLENEPRDHAIQYRTFLTARDINMYGFLVAPLFSPAGNLIGRLAIGTPVDPRGDLKKLLLTLLLLFGLMLLLAFAGGFWLADRAMDPVKTIAAKARRIGETDLRQRFNLGRKDEIGQLADVFDSMLARLDAAFARQRQFTADASHELRTPLTIVNLEASRALAAPRPAQEYQRTLQIIQSENALMSRLVNDLLTLARLDAGRELVQKEPLDLSDVALEAAERFQPLAQRQNVALTTGELPEVPVRGDRQALVRLLSNLLENAIKYTADNAPGSPRQVSIETGMLPDRAEGWARVTDTGPGIPAEHLEHVFDRFYRLDKSRARSSDSREENPFPSSSGLGLAIVDGIARLHGGRIEVSSQPGRATTFTLFLPLRT